MFIFDHQSEFYRYPQGGIEEEHQIKLKIFLKKSLSFRPTVKIKKRHDYINEHYDTILMEWIGAYKSYDLYQAKFKIKDFGQYYYFFDLDDTQSINNQGSQLPKHELVIYKKNYNTPEWLKGGIIYHIFVDRFYKNKSLHKDGKIVIRDDWGDIPNYLPDNEGEILNNDFFGGNLDGIREKLPYIKSLGVSAIYLSPIFDAYSNHKYDTGDYFSVDPMFGDENSLVKLCKEAETHGIGIILDGVFNHTGSDSIYFNKYVHYDSLGAYQSKESPYYSWYMFKNWNKDYESWWGIHTLPTVNKANESYIDFITGKNGVLKYWQRKGIKGWRLDVADELPDAFLEKIRAAVKEQDNEAYLVGEVWEDAANKYSYSKLKGYFCGKQLDSVTNYPLKDAIIEYVKNRNCNSLYETMNFIMEKYPPQTVNSLMNILGTHDTARILSVLGKQPVPKSKDLMAQCKLNRRELLKAMMLLKIAALLQFTLPGVPCVYYGDEVGLEGLQDPFSRRCFPWGRENKYILSYYRALSRLRKNTLFAEGKYKCLIHEDGVFAFKRYDEKNKLIIAVNLSHKPITVNTNEHMTDFFTKRKSNSFILKSGRFLALQ